MNANGDSSILQTSLAKLCFDPKTSRSTTTKRDSLAAELETASGGASKLATGTDVHLGTTNSQPPNACNEPQSSTRPSPMQAPNVNSSKPKEQPQTSNFKTKQRDKGPLIEQLERDRWYFADREKEEREEKERDQAKDCRYQHPHAQDTDDSNDTPPSAPISVTQTLTDLRLTRAHLLEEHGATSVSVHQRTAELASLESQNAQSFKLVQPLKAEVREAKEDATRIDLRLILVERDMEELEALLAENKNVNDQVANDLEALEGPMASTDELENVKKENKARQTISEHRQEIASQATKIDELKQALFYLSGKIAGGRHVPPKARVLYMAESLDQAWVDLRQATENEAVIKRLKELKESWVSSNTASRTWRQAGAAKYALAIGAETERNPFALVAIVNPSLDDARSMLAPMRIYTARGALLQPFTISGRAKTIESEVEGQWFEVEREHKVSLEYAGTIPAFFDADCSYVNGVAEAMALSPSRHKADMPFIDNGTPTMPPLTVQISDRALKNRAWKRSLARRQQKHAKLGVVLWSLGWCSTLGVVHLNGIGHEENSLQHTPSIDQHLCPISRLQVFELRYSYAPGTLRPLMISNRRKSCVDLHIPSLEEVDVSWVGIIRHKYDLRQT
ncbi:hypothetical protein BKA70DRAFT_1407390 [Coprinopsis sp. MPI-PUGE-AT-0042]|nr:hypothetical protein BKA70DRAFT_1407390 [Coprinopsis sp. MPI-PUGE-AT-0042]